MGPLLQGQLETLCPPQRAWGRRLYELRPGSPKNGDVHYEPVGGWHGKVLSFFCELETTGAEVNVEPQVELVNADNRRMWTVPSGFKVITATTTLLTYLPGAPTAGVLGIKSAQLSFPEMLLRPGDRIRFTQQRGAGEYFMFNPFWIIEEYENPRHHEDAEVASISAHLHAAAEAIENGTLEQGYPTR